MHISGILKLIISFQIIFFSLNAHATFYQADTMAGYCREYMKYTALDSSADPYQAGICSGYFSSKIEFISLSEDLCNKGNLNLDAVVREFIKTVENQPQASEQTATYVAVEVLQRKYACDG